MKINVPVGFRSPVLLSLNFLPTSLSNSLPPLPSLPHPSIPLIYLWRKGKETYRGKREGKDQGGGLCVNIPYVQIKNIKKGKLLCKKKLCNHNVLNIWGSCGHQPEEVEIEQRRSDFRGVCRLLEGEEGETEGGTDREGTEKKRLGPKACFSFSFSFFSLRGWRETNSGIVIFLFLYSLISNLICCTGNCNAFCL